jgi:hypothetical protein
MMITGITSITATGTASEAIGATTITITNSFGLAQSLLNKGTESRFTVPGYAFSLRSKIPGDL